MEVLAGPHARPGGRGGDATGCRSASSPVAGVSAPLLLVVAAIDNLVKGAAGQAVQNLNLMFGFDETEGLPCERRSPW